MTPNWEKREIKLKGDHGLQLKTDKIIKIYELELIDLITPVSLAVMQHLGISLNNTEEDANLVAAIPVTNDLCERAVQMATLFNQKGPKDETKRQDYYVTIDAVQNRHLKTVSDYDEFYKNLKKKQEE